MKAIWVKTEDAVSIYGNGKNVTVSNDHANYDKILELLKENEDVEKIFELVDIKKTLASVTYEKLSFTEKEDGSIYSVYDGQEFELAPALQKRLYYLMKNSSTADDTYTSFLKFLNNLYQNPSYRSIHQLYGFLTANDLPITSNGTFLAYKKVASNYKDIFSGTFDNSVGKTVSMPRNQVEDNPDKTCSAGLHVCSYDYLSNYGSTDSSLDRVVVVEVNPKDVVSVPTDYNNAKMRVSSYTVVDEIPSYFDAKLSSYSTVSHADGWLNSTYEKLYGVYKEFLGEKNFTWDEITLTHWNIAMINDLVAKLTEAFPEQADVIPDLFAGVVVPPSEVFTVLCLYDTHYVVENK